MNAPDDISPRLTGDQATVEATPQSIVVRDGGLRLVQICVVTGLALLIWWPLAILVVAVVVPSLAVLAVLAAALAVVAAPPWLLVRHLRGRDRAQRSTLLRNRQRP